MSGMRGAIFDLDGTLLDSMGMWSQIDREFLARRGIVCPEDYQMAINAMHFREAANYTVARFGLADTPEDLMREWSAMAFDRYKTDIPLKPGAGEYLRALSRAGLRLGVATALNAEMSAVALKRLGIDELFCAYARVEEVGLSKRHPDVYLLAAKRMGVTPERCRVYEDVLEGVMGAKAAGMAVCAIYDETSRRDHAQMRALADEFWTTWEGRCDGI